MDQQEPPKPATPSYQQLVAVFRCAEALQGTPQSSSQRRGHRWPKRVWCAAAQFRAHSPVESTLRPRQNLPEYPDAEKRGRVPKVRAGAFSPSALAMQHNCIRRYQCVMAPLSMYDTLSSNSTSAAEGGRRVTKVWWHASRTVHREHHSGACPLAPPHKHTRCHTRGHQRNAQHEANGTTRQPNDALPDATHAPLMMIRRHWTNKSYKKQSCLW